MRFFFVLTVGGLLFGQTTPTPTSLSVTRAYRVGNYTTRANIFDNRSSQRTCNYHSFLAAGSGSWTVTMQYQDGSSFGSWTSFGSTASVNQASNPAIGFGNGYHDYVSFLIVGSATVTYACSKDYFISSAVSSLSFPITTSQGGSGAASLSGVLIGNGTNPFSTVNGAPLQTLRVTAAGTGFEFSAPSSIQILASAYNFSGQTPGGSISIGSNTIALAPCPSGVSGSDTSHYLYISGGTGSAEAALITGGTCTSGATAGTVIVTAANTHSGAWTLASATGGIDEAACSIFPIGGDIAVASNLTLRANATGCGNTTLRVIKSPGAAVTGAFTVLNQTLSTYGQSQVAQVSPPWTTLATLYNGTQFDIGGYADNLQFSFLGAPVVQSLVGSVNTNAGNSGAAGFLSGVSGYARTGSLYQQAVGVYGGGVCGGVLTQCWGANFTVQHDANSIAGSNLVGVEVDVNHSAASNKAAIIKGITSVANLLTQPSGFANAYEAIRAGSSNFGFNVAYQSDDGAATNAFVAGRAAVSGATQSQNILLESYDGAAGHQAQIFEDSTGNLFIRPAPGKQIAFDPANNSSSTVVVLGAGGLIIGKNGFASLPSCNAGLEGTLWPVIDSNTAAWGATIAAGGSNHVLGFCNGTNWTVAAK